MNGENVTLIISLVLCFVALIAVILGNSSYRESEKVRAGLQECLEKTEIGTPIVLWKKECK